MKKTKLIPVACLAVLLTLLLLIPAVVMPTAAATTVTVYANKDFENLALDSGITTDNGFGAKGPSLAKIVSDGGDKVIDLPLAPAVKPGDSQNEYIYKGGHIQVVNSTVTVDGTDYPVVDGKVTIGDVTYTTYDECEKEVRYGGGNVDKNIVVSHTQMSYSTEDKVYLQAEYYISADAKGSVQLQFLNFSGTRSDTGARESANYYSIGYLVLDGGGLRTDLTSTVNGVFEKGAWNTLSIMIDLDTGERAFYVNGALVINEDLAYLTRWSEAANNRSYYKELTVVANKLIVAKINKTSGGGFASLAGYLRIDNVYAATHTDANLYSGEPVNGAGEHLVALKLTTTRGETKQIPYSYQNVFIGGTASITPIYHNFSQYNDVVAPVKGASIRLTHAAGMRFATQLDLDLFDKLLLLKEQGLVSDVSFGTMISPKQYVQSAGAFTVDALNGLPGTNAKYINVKGTVGAYHTKLPASALEEGYDTYFVGSITNIKLGNRDIDFSAIGYVKVVLPSGEDLYFYSYDYNTDTIGDYSRSITYLAERALNDPNTAYTAEQKVILSGLFEGATNVTLNSSAVQDVQYTPTELFFRNAAGVYCRLTYEGKNGWRLQANNKSYNSFNEMGAGQALSAYLGESVESKTKVLTITQGNGVLTVFADGANSYAQLSTGSVFDLSFYTAEGVPVSNLTSIEASEKETNISTHAVTIRGNLVSGEAVYGGGERFDVVNKRGTTLALYTQDGWNRTDTTYMAIPLFVTTRGAGMFINRYEKMEADFGATVDDEWSVTINNELIDCYFYATGKMSDALLGYTEISGHSSLPEEWGQGELICRYSPDLARFEDRTQYTTPYASYKDIPEFNKYGARTVSYPKYTDIPNYGDYYVKSVISGYKQISGISMSSFYNFDTLYSDQAGTKVKAFIKVNDRYFTPDNPQGLTYLPLKDIEGSGIAQSNINMNVFQALTYDASGNVNGISNTSNGMYALCNCGDSAYLANHYYKMGSKGNHGGDGVQTIVQNLIDAGMKPTAMVLEPWGWNSVSSNSDERQRLKETVDWLENACKSDKCAPGECTCTGIRTMLYMGVGGIGSGMKGYKEEYQVWATFTYDDGTVKDSYLLPRTSGAGENPDVAVGSAQSYIDITNPVAVEWYMNEIWGALIDIGVDGIKIDFCETMPDEGKYSDFTLKYDWYDPSVFEGDNVHHAYSTYFISLFYKSMIEQKAAKNIPDGFIVLSRGGGIGSQRNPYLWEGDQARDFAKIEDQLIALINSGISGVPFMTYDMAGYQYNNGVNQHNGTITLEKESEIFARAIEFTAFTSNIQTHGDVRHAYQMTEEVQEIYRRFTDIHEKLIPYIQRYSKIASDSGLPVVRAMVLEYMNDTNVYELETQYMLGEALLVAPVTTEATFTKDVYLPEGTWLDLLTGETYEVGAEGMHLTVAASLGQLPVFMNVNCSVEDNNLLAAVFNSDTWQKINGGIALNIEVIEPEPEPEPEGPVMGDPWSGDVFDD